MKKSFYDWCSETDNEYLLNLWDYDLNLEKPDEITIGTAKQFYFKCPRGIHESELYKINNITGPKHQVVNCRQCHSFGQWCLDNNQTELLDRWDYELNEVDPFHVLRSSSKKYYFKCPKLNPLHPSEAKMLSNVIKQPGSRRCIGCESFAQWCIDNVDKDFLEKYWSDKNVINPFTITTCSVTKVWIKCQEKEYHDDYEILPPNFKKGERCPYCKSKKVNYYDSFGYTVPESVKAWSDKNSGTPYDYSPYCSKKVWFHCDIHGDYMQKICDFTKVEGRCPECQKEKHTSVIQSKTEDYIESDLHLRCFHETGCTITPINPKTGYKLPFDIEVVDIKLIIEVNGPQHYCVTQFAIDSSKTNCRTPEEELEYQKWKDEYKKEYALSMGYYYLEIPYWTFDKHESYKTLIDKKIEEIKISNNLISTVTTTGDDRQLSS